MKCNFTDFKIFQINGIVLFASVLLSDSSLNDKCLSKIQKRKRMQDISVNTVRRLRAARLRSYYCQGQTVFFLPPRPMRPSGPTRFVLSKFYICIVVI